jgi:hypothetical protein
MKKKPISKNGGPQSMIKRPITIKLPEYIHKRLQADKIKTGCSIQSAVLTALEIPPRPPHPPDVELWLAVKEQRKSLPRAIIVDRLLIWLMQHELKTGEEVIL